MKSIPQLLNMFLYNLIVLLTLANSTAVLLAVAPAVVLAVGDAKYYQSVSDLYNCNCVCKPDKYIFLISLQSGFDSQSRPFSFNNCLLLAIILEDGMKTLPQPLNSVHIQFNCTVDIS